MTLIEAQQLFAELVGRLLTQAVAMGYCVTLGEAWRPPETAALYAKEGKGIVNSLHCDRLAIDLNLFKNGEYLESVADYAPLGQWWKSQHDCCRWGGDFQRQDAVHYSFTYGGRQ